MQVPPLQFLDLTLLLLVGAIMLLLLYEFSSNNYSPINMLLNRKRLRYIALLADSVFFVAFTIQALGIIRNLSV